MASTSDIRNGLCIEHNNGIYKIVEFQHVKPGKGAAFVRTKLKSLTTGRVLDNTFPAGHKITDVRVERKQYQYLYKDGDEYHFMDTETYEQLFFNAEMLDAPELLKEGVLVDVMFDSRDGSPLTSEMPHLVELEVTYTEPGLKGDTATNALKPATLETGAEVRVPLFINTGDFVRVDTRTKSYHERVKK